MQLYRYKCGCIGFPPSDNGEALIVKTCGDTDEFYLYFHYNEMKDPTQYSPISVAENISIIAEIKNVLGLGYKARELRNSIRNLLQD